MLITHDLQIVKKMADHVCVMKDGQIVEQGGNPALFADPRHPYTKALLSAVPRISGGGIPDIAEDMDGFHDPLIAHEGYSERELLK